MEQILTHLRQNARISLTEISKKTGIPVSSLAVKIKKMEDEKVIRKYATLLDLKKLGYDTFAHIALKVHREDREELLKFVDNHPEINSAYEIDSGYDFLIETVHKSQTELKRFVELLTEKFEITHYDIYYMIGTIKKEKFLSDK